MKYNNLQRLPRCNEMATRSRSAIESTWPVRDRKRIDWFSVDYLQKDFIDAIVGMELLGTNQLKVGRFRSW